MKSCRREVPSRVTGDAGVDGGLLIGLGGSACGSDLDLQDETPGTTVDVVFCFDLH